MTEEKQTKANEMSLEKAVKLVVEGATRLAAVERWFTPSVKGRS